MEKIRVIAIVGPTASGKTSLAIEIAKHINGEIVSADSMQIYKGMEIATAKPSSKERAQIPHHMIDFLEPSESYSAADYVKDATKAVDDIVSRDKVPVIAGGTGLYIDSLLQGVEFGYVPENKTLRLELQNRMDIEGAEKLLSELDAVDPETASCLHANNKGRIIRALEVYYLTGDTISEQKRKSREKESSYDTLYIGIEYKDREKLYERIDRRVDKMVDDGLLDEAKQYINLDDDTTAGQAIGYKELKPYFNGSISLEEAICNLKKQTRHYAKRQMTWFRRNKDIFYVFPDADDDYVSSAVQAAEHFLIKEKD